MIKLHDSLFSSSKYFSQNVLSIEIRVGVIRKKNKLNSKGNISKFPVLFLFTLWLFFRNNELETHIPVNE